MKSISHKLYGMNVLILGYGQIGCTLAEQLSLQGHQVTAVSRHIQQICVLEHLQQDIMQLDLSQTEKRFDWAYVILAPSQRSVLAYQQTFIDTIRPIYQALDGHPIQKIVFISSTSIYGENQGQWIDDNTQPQTQNRYGQCLIAAEQLTAAYWQEKLIIVRPSGLYQAQSQYLQKQAVQAETVAVEHWTNRIHREDLVGFLAYLLTLAQPKAHYLLSDQLPTVQHEIWQAFRRTKGLSSLNIPEDLVVTGKRILATHLNQSGYVLQYPTWREGYGVIQNT